MDLTTLDKEINDLSLEAQQRVLAGARILVKIEKYQSNIEKKLATGTLLESCESNLYPLERAKQSLHFLYK